jgi:hypothetical protein
MARGQPRAGHDEPRLSLLELDRQAGPDPRSPTGGQNLTLDRVEIEAGVAIVSAGGQDRSPVQAQHPQAHRYRRARTKRE